MKPLCISILSVICTLAMDLPAAAHGSDGQADLSNVGRIVRSVESGRLSREEGEKQIRQLLRRNSSKEPHYKFWSYFDVLDMVALYVEDVGAETALESCRGKILTWEEREGSGVYAREYKFHSLVLARYGGEEELKVLKTTMDNDDVDFAVRFGAAYGLARYGGKKWQDIVLAFLAKMPAGTHGRIWSYDCGMIPANSNIQEYIKKHEARFHVDEGETIQMEDLFREILATINTREAHEVHAKAMDGEVLFFFARGYVKWDEFMAENAPDLFLPYLERLITKKEGKDVDWEEQVIMNTYGFQILVKYYADRLSKQWFIERFIRCFYDPNNPGDSWQERTILPGSGVYPRVGVPIEEIWTQIEAMPE
jgi:hypothetical protein